MKGLIMEVSKETKKGEVEVSLSGELTIKRAVEFKKKLSDLLDRYNEVTLKAESISNIDLTGLQLIQAAKKTAAGKGKKLSLSVSLTEEIEILLDRAGVKGMLG